MKSLIVVLNAHMNRIFFVVYFLFLIFKRNFSEALPLFLDFSLSMHFSIKSNSHFIIIDGLFIYDSFARLG